MSDTNRGHRPVHLVGSVPLADAAAVFETAASILGDRVSRLPDGETGDRSHWISWQRAVLASNPSLEPAPDWGPVPQFALRAGHAEAAPFGNLGYADAALASWQAFRALKSGGKIARGQKFLVSLPTPLAAVALYIEPASQAAVEPVYREALYRELSAICREIPHDQLAIQWDVAVEFMILEGLRPTALGGDPFGAVVARLLEDIAEVPGDVECGLHLCYGDSGGRHFKEPDDTALMVRVSNAVFGRASRPLQWLHMPVPQNRSDPGYFAPLADLRLPGETQLFLGLVHDADGEEGCRNRIAAAEKFIHGFGVATECGFGRRQPDAVAPLLALHAAL